MSKISGKENNSSHALNAQKTGIIKIKKQLSGRKLSIYNIQIEIACRHDLI